MSTEPGAGGETRAEGGGPTREPWLLAAGLCVVAAAACLILGFYDAAFVTAALGAVAWFLNVRGKLPRPAEDTDAETEEDADAEPSAGGDDSED